MASITLSASYVFLIINIVSGYARVSKVHWQNIFLPLTFLLTAFTLLYSGNYKTGFQVIERQVNLLALPLLFLFLGNKQKLNFNLIILFLSIALLSSYLLAIYNFNTNVGFTELWENSYNLKHFIFQARAHNFSFFNHPSYYALLILIHAVCFFTSFSKLKGGLIVFHTITIAVGIIVLIFLNSRAGFITLLILIVYYLIKFFIHGSIIKGIVVLVISVSALFVMVNYTRLGVTFQQLKNTNAETNKPDRKDPRLLIWQNAITVIKEKPVFGYGVGDALDVLIEEHERTGFKKAAEERWDAHNQFLETTLQSGIIGLLLLLAAFFVPMYQAIRKRQELLFLFLMVCFINFLFESMLIRLAGVVYFAFFYSYLIFMYYPSLEKSKQSQLKPK